MAIGKVRKQIRKTHGSYKTARVRHLLSKCLRMPGDSGFIELQGSIKYRARDRSAVVTVSSRRRPDNRAPGIFIKRRFEDWSLNKVRDGSPNRTLMGVLEDVANQVKSRTLPERSLFLDKCNPSGKQVDKFIATACASCRSWYCELSSG
jgi:hypothetical protein